MSGFEVPKLKSVARPADYDGKVANTGFKKEESNTTTAEFANAKLKSAGGRAEGNDEGSKESSGGANPFAVKLKTVQRPADYDGKEPTTQFKESASATPEFSNVQLKKVNQ